MSAVAVAERGVGLRTGTSSRSGLATLSESGDGCASSARGGARRRRRCLRTRTPCIAQSPLVLYFGATFADSCAPLSVPLSRSRAENRISMLNPVRKANAIGIDVS